MPINPDAGLGLKFVSVCDQPYITIQNVTVEMFYSSSVGFWFFCNMFVLLEINIQ